MHSEFSLHFSPLLLARHVFADVSRSSPGGLEKFLDFLTILVSLASFPDAFLSSNKLDFFSPSLILFTSILRGIPSASFFLANVAFIP